MTFNDSPPTVKFMGYDEIQLMEMITYCKVKNVDFLIIKSAATSAALAKALGAFDFIANRENLTFAECSDAEEIIAKARDTAAELRKIVGQ